MKIAICEDDANYRSKLAAQIKKCIKLDIQIDEYGSGDALLQAYDIGQRYDLLFMDIQMPGISGTDAAVKVREMDRNSLFVFISFLQNEVRKAFGVRAMDYICKTGKVEDLQLEPVLERCILEFTEINRQIPMPTDSGIIDLQIRDIEYVKSVDKKAVIYLTTGEEIPIISNLKNVIKKLQAFDFEQCHKSYIINLRSIYDFAGNEIITNTGAKVPVSRRQLKPVQMAHDKLNASI